MKEESLFKNMNYYGSSHDDEPVKDREIVKEPTPRVKKAKNLYFETKSSASMEFPYWYTRRWQELEGEIAIIRR